MDGDDKLKDEQLEEASGGVGIDPDLEFRYWIYRSRGGKLDLNQWMAAGCPDPPEKTAE